MFLTTSNIVLVFFSLILHDQCLGAENERRVKRNLGSVEADPTLQSADYKVRKKIQDLQ